MCSYLNLLDRILTNRKNCNLSNFIICLTFFLYIYILFQVCHHDSLFEVFYIYIYIYINKKRLR
ncbi:hypothetical protein BJ944DRAFT_260815 [Cunninghamella echinulata]|nr:hypothetical protein BJ944DRAFT_260815 [Cunninghamella echinulata]